MGRTLAEIEKGLSVRYDGPTEEKRGFTYVPWVESVKQANRIFGIDGYDIDVLEVRREGAGYMAKVRVTAHPTDSHSFYRDGIGYNELTTTRSGDEMIDTAIKGAVSDGANRAFKLFGDAFALYLYDRTDAARTSEPTKTNSAAPARTAAPAANKDDLGFRPSENQLKFARSLGWSDEDFARMPFKEWKAILDQKQRKPAANKVAPVKPAKQAEPEELDLESMFG